MQHRASQVPVWLVDFLRSRLSAEICARREASRAMERIPFCYYFPFYRLLPLHYRLNGMEAKLLYSQGKHKKLLTSLVYFAQFVIFVAFYNISIISWYIISKSASCLIFSFGDSRISFKKIYYEWFLLLDFPDVKNRKRSKPNIYPSPFLPCLCHRYNRVSLKAAKRRRSFMACCIAAMCLNEIFMQHKERRRGPLLCEGSSFYLLRPVFLTSYQMRIPRVLLEAHRSLQGVGVLFLDSQCAARVSGFSGFWYFHLVASSRRFSSRARVFCAHIFAKRHISERTVPYMPRTNNVEDKVETGGRL